MTRRSYWSRDWMHDVIFFAEVHFTKVRCIECHEVVERRFY